MNIGSLIRNTPNVKLVNKKIQLDIPKGLTTQELETFVLAYRGLVCIECGLNYLQENPLGQCLLPSVTKGSATIELNRWSKLTKEVVLKNEAMCFRAGQKK